MQELTDRHREQRILFDLARAQQAFSAGDLALARVCFWLAKTDMRSRSRQQVERMQQGLDAALFGNGRKQGGE